MSAGLAFPRVGEADTEAAVPGGSGSSVDVVPADLESVERMCLLLTGCDRLPLPSGSTAKDFVACTRALYAELASPSAVSFSLTLRDCGLRATSCSELRACALRGAKADVCTGRGKVTPVEMCDGDGRAVMCSNERVSLVRDCPRGGEQCVIRDGHAACALGSCDKESAAACSASGTRILECKRGKLLSLDCQAFGLRCSASVDGPHCVTSRPSCSGDAMRCEGNIAVACRHEHEVRVDCGARGLSCVGSDGGETSRVGSCAAVAVPGACDSSAPAACDSGTLQWCAWGKRRDVTCKSIGLSRCIVDDKGARCVP